MKSFKVLADLAASLDKMGLFSEADVIDKFIVEATGERKFTIAARGKVGVKAAVYNSLSDIQEPPAESQVKADGTLTVFPVENGQVVTAKPLFTKAYTARNIDELKAKMATDVSVAKQHYAPASYDEQFDFYPV